VATISTAVATIGQGEDVEPASRSVLKFHFEIPQERLSERRIKYSFGTEGLFPDLLEISLITA
jgi:hypothetical protein